MEPSVRAANTLMICVWYMRIEMKAQVVVKDVTSRSLADSDADERVCGGGDDGDVARWCVVVIFETGVSPVATILCP